MTLRCGAGSEEGVAWGLLTAGPLPQHLDAPLRATLGLLQLALVGVGGRVGAAHGRHQRRALQPLAHALGLGRVGGVALAHGAEAAKHPPAACGKENF